MKNRDVIYLFIMNSSDDVEHLTELCGALDTNEFLCVLAIHDGKDLENKSFFLTLENTIKDFPKIIEFNLREYDIQASSIYQEISKFLREKRIDGIILSKKLIEVGKSFDKAGIPVMIY
ncbi:MAG: hypothetical protein ACE5K4_01475 [Candidatus Hydrothermarchaeota archaeon]